MGIGYLIGIVGVGIVVSFFFARLAAEKGYPVSRARRYPLLLMVATVIVSLVLSGSVILLGQMMEGLRTFLSMAFMVANWFLIAVYLVILNKAYSNMKLAPDAEALRARMKEMQAERKSSNEGIDSGQ